MLVVVYTDDGDILLLRRRQPFEFWQSVTGSLRHGETGVEAARRELHEETGMTDEGELTLTGVTREFEIDPRWRDRYPEGVTINEEHEFRYRLGQPRDIRLHDEEHSAYRWTPIDEAIDTVWSWTNRDALVELRRCL